MSETRIKIEVYPDYLDTIIAALEQKKSWHEEQTDAPKEDEAVIVWLSQIIQDLTNQQIELEGKQ
jgi:hypothetical protein